MAPVQSKEILKPQKAPSNRATLPKKRPLYPIFNVPEPNKKRKKEVLLPEPQDVDQVLSDASRYPPEEYLTPSNFSDKENISPEDAYSRKAAARDLLGQCNASDEKNIPAEDNNAQDAGLSDLVNRLLNDEVDDDDLELAIATVAAEEGICLGEDFLPPDSDIDEEEEDFTEEQANSLFAEFGTTKSDDVGLQTDTPNEDQETVLEGVARISRVIMDKARATTTVYDPKRNNVVFHPAQLRLLQETEPSQPGKFADEMLIPDLKYAKPTSLRDLLRILPLFDSAGLWKRAGFYILVGEHEDGRLAVYVGQSSDLRKRILTHYRNIQHVRNGRTDTISTDAFQHVQWLLGEPGWKVHSRILGSSKKCGVPADRFVTEASLMLYFNAYDKKHHGIYSTSATCKFASAIQVPAAFQDVLSLNHSFPLLEQLVALGSKARTGPVKCDLCPLVVPPTTQMNRRFPEDPDSALICFSCARNRANGKERSAEAVLKALERKRVAETVPKGDRCHSCQELWSETKHSTSNVASFILELGMWVCQRERRAYHKTGKLRPHRKRVPPKTCSHCNQFQKSNLHYIAELDDYYCVTCRNSYTKTGHMVGHLHPIKTEEDYARDPSKLYKCSACNRTASHRTYFTWNEEWGGYVCKPPTERYSTSHKCTVKAQVAARKQLPITSFFG